MYEMKKVLRRMNFMFAPCINDIKHFFVQLRLTNYNMFRLLN